MVPPEDVLIFLLAVWWLAAGTVYHEHIHTHKHTQHEGTHTHTHLHTHKHSMRAHTHTYIHIHTQHEGTHTHTHTHIHTAWAHTHTHTENVNNSPTWRCPHPLPHCWWLAADTVYHEHTHTQSMRAHTHTHTQHEGTHTHTYTNTQHEGTHTHTHTQTHSMRAHTHTHTHTHTHRISKQWSHLKTSSSSSCLSGGLLLALCTMSTHTQQTHTQTQQTHTHTQLTHTHIHKHTAWGCAHTHREYLSNGPTWRRPHLPPGCLDAGCWRCWPWCWQPTARESDPCLWWTALQTDARLVSPSFNQQNSRGHCIGGMLGYQENCLVGLVVKASSLRAEDPGFESCLRQDFFRVESYLWLKHWNSSGYPARRLAL